MRGRLGHAGRRGCCRASAVSGPRIPLPDHTGALGAVPPTGNSSQHAAGTSDRDCGCKKRDELSLTQAQKPWWPHTALRRGLLQDTGPGRPPTKAVCREGVGSSQNRREGDAEADDRPAEDTPRASSSCRTRDRDPGAGEKPSGCGAAQTRPRPGPGAVWGAALQAHRDLGGRQCWGRPPGCGPAPPHEARPPGGRAAPTDTLPSAVLC